MATTSCYRCGAALGDLSSQGAVGRRTTCPECDADLHACINCKYYDETAPHECREPHAEKYLDKESSNACDLFQLGDGASRRRQSSPAAKEALHALFGEAPKKASGDPEERGSASRRAERESAEHPNDALEALFKKK